MNEIVISVRRGRFFYRATTTLTVHRLSPYRSIFAIHSRDIAAWGRSEESARERCLKRAELIKRGDDEWYENEQERTTKTQVTL